MRSAPHVFFTAPLLRCSLCNMSLVSDASDGQFSFVRVVKMRTYQALTSNHAAQMFGFLLHSAVAYATKWIELHSECDLVPILETVSAHVTRNRLNARLLRLWATDHFFHHWITYFSLTLPSRVPVTHRPCGYCLCPPMSLLPHAFSVMTTA